MNQWIQFKTETEKKEYPSIRGRLKIILDDMADFFKVHGHEFIITDLLEEKGEFARLHRVSHSHEEARAADLRVRGLPLEFINLVIKTFSEKYESRAALSKESGLPCLIVYHDNGNGIHFHVQIKPYKEN